LVSTDSTRVSMAQKSALLGSLSYSQSSSSTDSSVLRTPSTPRTPSCFSFEHSPHSDTEDTDYSSIHESADCFDQEPVEPAFALQDLSLNTPFLQSDNIFESPTKEVRNEHIFQWANEQQTMQWQNPSPFSTSPSKKPSRRPDLKM